MISKTELEGKPDARNEAAPWPDGIAIVGMSARFPGSRNVDEYWQHLLAGDLLISDLSPEDLLAAGVDPQAFNTKQYVRKGSSIADAESFDTELFGLSRREAEVTDPQQRVLLECAWEALEHAGHLGSEPRTGVFAGAGLNSYLLQLLSRPEILADVGGYQLMLGNDKDFLATRIAYKLNLKGPALTVQTACSTSLAAVHLACQSILRGECAMALAGGVSIGFPQLSGYPYIPGMILSPDGFCRPFDADARGTVPGRGAGLVVLKRLAEAVADRDTIYAVIRGSAWNNDGAEKVGYTVPSVEGQAAVIRSALAAADAPASCIGFIEAHGTATELGDPIEFTALRAVFDQSSTQPGSCLLGSVKSNMGHADVAAGIAGLIKASLAVHSGQVPPTLHFKRPNPYLGFEGGPFAINTATAPWPRAGERWAGVSSFGIGGTNVHAVISEAPFVPSTPEDEAPRIFPISARTPAALQASCDRLREHLLANSGLNHADVAATLQRGRRHLGARQAIVAASTLEVTDLLQSPPKKRQPGDSSLAREVIFLFPGQGQQFHGMAQSLYCADAMFRQTVDEGVAVLRGECEADLVEIVVQTICGSKSAALPRITDTSLAQPLLFLTEYALAQRWISLGVEPAALLGHSLGELVAATIAGVFSFEDGLRVAARRGRIMSSSRPGLMLAVTLPPEKLANYLDRDVWLAAENGPAMSVASGIVEAIETLEGRLSADRIPFVRLESQNAFHTPLMAEAAQAFRQEVESVTRRAPAIPWLSNVTGKWIDSAEAQSPQYWGTQILSRVRFTQNLAELGDRPRLLLEVGPGEALTGIARRQLPASVLCASLGSKNRRQSDHLVFLNAAASMWERGVDIDLPALSTSSGRRIPLPTYPFERQRCFIEPLQNQAIRSPQQSSSNPNLEPKPVLIKRADIASWFYTPSWQSTPPASIALTQKAQPIDCWLILTDHFGLGDALAAKLLLTGATVLTAAAADVFHVGKTHFALSPNNPEQVHAMWQEIARRGLRPTGLIDLWAMLGMNLSGYDTLALTLLAAGRVRQSFRQIEVITDHLQSPTGGPVVEMERAEILGLARAIPAEYPGTEVRSIDVDLSPTTNGSTETIEETAAILADEIAFSGPRLNVAYRNGQRWNQLWTPAPLQQPLSEPFRDGGVYVITGGMGGIGFVLARHLMRQHKARVALIGRTPLPPAEEQEDWLGLHGADDPVSRRILRLRELQAAPGDVMLLVSDVEESAALGDALAQVRQRYGPINGVVHAAGIAAGGMIASQDVVHAAATRAPKVKGSIVLAELLRQDKLDFFLLTSSISAVVPPPSQAAYAAANAFQDHFAGYCRSTLNLPAVAINLDAWQEFGMAAEMVLPEGFDAQKDKLLQTAMTPEEGIEAIRRIVALWTSSRILVSTVPLESLLEAAQPEIVASTSAEDTGYDSGAAQDAPAAGEELAIILAIWKELLAAEDIQPEDNFFQLGGHSLMGTMLILRIRDRFDVVLTLRMIFENPTPRGLANIVSTQREAAMPVPVLQGEREEFEF